MSTRAWLVCQIGARENYAVARALQANGALAGLVTDAWVPKGHPLARVLPRLGERVHPALEGLAMAPTATAVAREVIDRARKRAGWPQIMARNAWFQRMAVARLERMWPDGPAAVFAYAYGADEVLSFAKTRGALAVLGQIDPGPVEARLVDALYQSAGQPRTRVPDAYWQGWRRETELADVIVVNSMWSREGLLTEGVPAEKITVVPLAYEGPCAAPRTPPATFTPERPLRLLFLGQVTLRKGIDIVFDAMADNPEAPLALDVVGPLQVDAPAHVRRDPRIRLHGAVPRSKVAAFYAAADIFVFPTRSDGFGLTQLEAMAARVPVIASRHCGDVVQDGVNGRIVEPLDSNTLGSVLAGVLAEPARLATWCAGTGLAPRFRLDTLGSTLMRVAAEYDGRKGESG